MSRPKRLITSIKSAGDDMISISLLTFDAMFMPARPASVPMLAAIDDNRPPPPFSSLISTVALRSYRGANISRNRIAAIRAVVSVAANHRQCFLHSLIYCCRSIFVDSYLNTRMATVVSTDTIDIQNEMLRVSLPFAVD